MVNLNRCIPSRTEDLNLSVFNMIIGINESKTLTKHISCKCKCKLDCKNCNSNQKWNTDKCQHEYKNQKEHYVCKKDYIWNPATCSCENGKYLASIIDDSVVSCDEIIDTTKSILAKTVSMKTVTTKTIPIKSNSKNFYVLLAFLLITIAFLIAVSIYCYFIKYPAKEKYYCHITSQIYMNNII